MKAVIKERAIRHKKLSIESLVKSLDDAKSLLKLNTEPFMFGYSKQTVIGFNSIFSVATFTIGFVIFMAQCWYRNQLKNRRALKNLAPIVAATAHLPAAKVHSEGRAAATAGRSKRSSRAAAAAGSDRSSCAAGGDRSGRAAASVGRSRSG